jgi:hypothetical protein
MGYIGNGPYQGVLTGGNIQDGTVETTDLADGAVTTVKINDGAVTAAKLAAGAIPDATSLEDSGGTTRVQATTSGADVTGNLNVTGEMNFTGSTTNFLDYRDSLNIRTQNSSPSGYETSIYMLKDSGVYLNYDGVSKLNTASFGASVTGTLEADYLTARPQNGGVGSEGGEIKLTGASGYGEVNLDNYAGGFRIHGTFGVPVSVDSAGRVTMPYQPVAAVSRETSTWSTLDTIVWNAVYLNVGSHYNASTGVFTCPVAGHYLVSIMTMSGSQSTMDIELRKNGATTQQLVPYQTDTGALHNQVSGMTVVNCAANDTLAFKLNSGSIYAGTSGRHSAVLFKLLN